MAKLSVELAPQHKFGLILKNPVMVASGTFGQGTELRRMLDVSRLGAIVSVSVTRYSRRGNGQPRIIESAAGLLHSVGMQNRGVEAVIRTSAPLWESFGVPVIVNILAGSAQEFADLAGRFEGVAGVAALELNLSDQNAAQSPDTRNDSRSAAEATGAARRHTSLPVIAKISAVLSDTSEIARGVEDAGADAICCTNSLPGVAIDIREREPVFASIFGGVSGPAIKPLALRAVWQIASAVKIPIIGAGGIQSGNDAIEFLMAGATAVQVGSVTFRDPLAAVYVLEGIERFLEDEGIDDVNSIIGAAHGGNERRNIEV